MDFKFLGKNKEMIQYYWDGDDDTELPRIKSFIKNNRLLRKINILYLIFDGNTLTINGQNWQVNRLIKEFKKFVSSNVQKKNL